MFLCCKIDLIKGKYKISFRYKIKTVFNLFMYFSVAILIILGFPSFLEKKKTLVFLYYVCAHISPDGGAVALTC